MGFAFFWNIPGFLLREAVVSPAKLLGFSNGSMLMNNCATACWSKNTASPARVPVEIFFMCPVQGRKCPQLVVSRSSAHSSSESCSFVVVPDGALCLFAATMLQNRNHPSHHFSAMACFCSFRSPTSAPCRTPSTRPALLVCVR